MSQQSIIRKGVRLSAAALFFFGALASPPVSASSHREAPFTANHPAVDDTDFYMFRDPNDATKVNLIANRFGLIEPTSGPNFAGFKDGARYDIKIDNNGDAIEDITYRWTFKTTYRQPGTFLYALPGATTVDDASLLVVQTYSIDKILGPSANPEAARVTRILSDFPVLPPNIGPKTFPQGYANLTGGLHDAGNGRRAFTGPRQDPFFVDLGMVFDAINLNTATGAGRPGVGVGNMGGGKDTLYAYTVLSTTIQVPIAELTSTGTQITDVLNPAAIISAWASISAPATETVNANGSVTASGAFQQISRLGNPLVNELLIGVGTKDMWNATPVSAEAQYKSMELRPILATYLNVLFGVVVPPNTSDRADIQAALFTGLPAALGILTTRPNEVYSDQLRLNTAIPVTPFNQASRMGVLGGDLAGYPNGRRICDDVVDIDLRVVAGVLYGAAGGANGALYTGSPNKNLGDGVDSPQRGCRYDFPYMWSPTSGFANLHTPDVNPTHPAGAAAAKAVLGFPRGADDQENERTERAHTSSY
ncbi:MAG: DUF4331 domain-containing protein [Thermoanaerobaculia bacterium]